METGKVDFADTTTSIENEDGSKTSFKVSEYLTKEECLVACPKYDPKLQNWLEYNKLEGEISGATRDFFILWYERIFKVVSADPLRRLAQSRYHEKHGTPQTRKKGGKVRPTESIGI